MSVFYRDKIKIRRTAIDKYGVKNYIISDDIECHVAEVNKLVPAGSKNEVIASTLIYLDNSVEVGYNDSIAIIKITTEDFIQPTKFFKIKSIVAVNGFRIHHKEVYLENASAN